MVVNPNTNRASDGNSPAHGISVGVKKEVWDLQLRPLSWQEYMGQEKIKEALRISIEAAKKRGAPLEHALFYGGSGLGKTSLAHLVAQELGVGIRVCTGPSVEKAGDLASLLTNGNPGDVLFLDEAHRLPRQVTEALYSAMEDFTLHLVMGRGPMARTMDLSIPPFTLIGATTRLAMLPAPLRNRFGHVFRFDFYESKEIEQVVARTASLMGIHLAADARSKIAARSRYTPRTANHLLKRVRDFALIEGDGNVTGELVDRAFNFLEIDELGLEESDRKLLTAILQRFRGGPVGLQTMASTIGEDKETILDVYEPYLLQLGFLERTPRGRMTTAKAAAHLGITSNRIL